MVQIFGNFEKTVFKNIVEDAIKKWPSDFFNSASHLIYLEKLSESNRSHFLELREHLNNLVLDAEKRGDDSAESRAKVLYGRVKDL